MKDCDLDYARRDDFAVTLGKRAEMQAANGAAREAAELEVYDAIRIRHADFSSIECCEFARRDQADGRTAS